jgi:hypothetical protein
MQVYKNGAVVYTVAVRPLIDGKHPNLGCRVRLEVALTGRSRVSELTPIAR